MASCQPRSTNAGAQVPPRQLRTEDAVLRPEEVVGRVLRPGPVVVVAAEHEHAGPVEQGAQRAQHEGHRTRVGEVVPGVDDEVGLELGQAGDEALLGALPGPQVQIGDVQHAQRAGAGRQDGQRGVAQREPVPLDDRGVAQSERAGGGSRGGRPGQAPGEPVHDAPRRRPISHRVLPVCRRRAPVSAHPRRAATAARVAGAARARCRWRPAG